MRRREGEWVSDGDCKTFDAIEKPSIYTFFDCNRLGHNQWRAMVYVLVSAVYEGSLVYRHLSLVYDGWCNENVGQPMCYILLHTATYCHILHTHTHTNPDGYVSPVGTSDCAFLVFRW